MTKTIGVIGLGIIGSVWARHYAADGILAGAWNRSPMPNFPHWLASPESVAGAAEARKNTFYLGGSAADAAEAEPVLSLVSERRFHVGNGRQAAALKLAINLNIALQMAALGESLAFARQAGIDDDTYFKVLEKNVSCSPLVKLKESNLRSGKYPAQFSVKHMHKNMRLARDAIGAATLPLLECVREQLRRAESAGLGGEDFSALVKLAASALVLWNKPQ